jgi:peroxiredoxin Q/BCP
VDPDDADEEVLEMANAGDRIPDLTVTLHDGTRTTLSALAAGGPLVVFFYPKAFTAGCTAQACHFRDLGAEFTELGASRVGVSRDDAATQSRFVGEHRFDYPLIADRDGTVAKAFGAKRVGPVPSRRRTTVLDADLTVLDVISDELRMDRHADDALAVLRAHRAGSAS